MVTVVDGNAFWKDFASGDTLLDRKQQTTDEDEREIADLLIDQIEFANVILLNKTDLLSPVKTLELKQVIRSLNPDAEVIETAFSTVPLDRVLNTKLFDFEKSGHSAGWLKELNGEHIPETEEYGITSFVYRSQNPFHPERLMAWMLEWPVEVVRAKGFLWIASRDDAAVLLSQAGPSLSIEYAGAWDHDYGVKMTELALIGINMDQQELTDALDLCLLTEEEMLQDWRSFYDPLPKFQNLQEE
jgi:G3E family GTPase